MAVKLPQGVSKKELTAEFFSKYFWHNEATGELLWKPRDLSDFTTQHQSNVWHTRFSFKPAGSVSKPWLGYSKIQITFAGQTFSAHRVVAVMCGLLKTYGDRPHIDHKDGNPMNNRLSNLRLANPMINARNRKKINRGSNKATGVYWNSKAKKYQATIGRGPSKGNLIGYFDDWFDAVCARKAAEIGLGYTRTHGQRL